MNDSVLHINSYYEGGESILEQQLAELITNVGFPIACTCALFWLLKGEQTAHKEESEHFTTAINNNTTVLEKILMVLRKDNLDE